MPDEERELDEELKEIELDDEIFEDAGVDLGDNSGLAEDGGGYGMSYSMPLGLDE